MNTILQQAGFVPIDDLNCDALEVEVITVLVDSYGTSLLSGRFFEALTVLAWEGGARFLQLALLGGYEMAERLTRTLDEALDRLQEVAEAHADVYLFDSREELEAIGDSAKASRTQMKYLKRTEPSLMGLRWLYPGRTHKTICRSGKKSLD